MKNEQTVQCFHPTFSDHCRTIYSLSAARFSTLPERSIFFGASIDNVGYFSSFGKRVALCGSGPAEFTGWSAIWSGANPRKTNHKRLMM